MNEQDCMTEKELFRNGDDFGLVLNGDVELMHEDDFWILTGREIMADTHKMLQSISCVNNKFSTYYKFGRGQIPDSSEEYDLYVAISFCVRRGFDPSKPIRCITSVLPSISESSSVKVTKDNLWIELYAPDLFRKFLETPWTIYG